MRSKGKRQSSKMIWRTEQDRILADDLHRERGIVAERDEPCRHLSRRTGSAADLLARCPCDLKSPATGGDLIM